MIRNRWPHNRLHDSIDIEIRNRASIMRVRTIEDRVLRKLFLGFMQIHILHHAAQEPIYGLWMLEELAHHGYRLSAGMLYPLLHSLENQGLLSREDRLVDGKIRKYYTTTSRGLHVLAEARQKASQLFQEITD